jgi:flagellar motor switch protein FliG
MKWINKISSYVKRKVHALTETRKVEILTNMEIAKLLDTINFGDTGDSGTGGKLGETPLQFIDFAALNDIDIQKIILKSNIHDITMTLLSIDANLHDKIYINMSEQDVINIKNSIKCADNIKQVDIVKGRTKFFSTIYYLAKTGEIVIPKKFHFPGNFDKFFSVFRKPSSFDSMSKYTEEFENFFMNSKQNM